MSKKLKVLISLAAVLAVALGTGAVILAASNYGTQEDPLITLSYLNEKLKPELMAAFTEELAKARGEVDAQLQQRIAELGGVSAITPPLSQSPPSSPSAGKTEAETFELVTLTKNRTVKCAVGTELLLRIGTANGTGGAPALIDSTTGETLAPGAALAPNHMYMATIADNGLTAVSDTVKILIRGDYTIA